MLLGMQSLMVMFMTWKSSKQFLATDSLNKVPEEQKHVYFCTNGHSLKANIYYAVNN